MGSQLHHVRSQKYDVFLSFAEQDKDFAEEMRRRLVSHAKLRVFVPSDGESVKIFRAMIKMSYQA